MIRCLHETVVHGSDWGSVIGSSIAVQHKQQCKGYHTVMPMATPPIPTLGNILFHPFKVAKLCASMIVGPESVYGASEFRFKGKNFADVVNDEDAGYRAIQGTRPYTLSQGLTDSPAGLLSKYRVTKKESRNDSNPHNGKQVGCLKNFTLGRITQHKSKILKHYLRPSQPMNS